jgi:hypothetical protein
MAYAPGLSQDAKDLIQQGDELFSDRLSLMSLWQEVAEHFYPERADFTTVRALGQDFAADLNSSYPLYVRRELGNSYGSMLRRRDQNWFNVSIDREERLDDAGREWLEYATGVQRRAMYDLKSQFVRATKEGDHDFATFGQCIISEEINWKNVALLYRAWHIRDIAWREGEDGSITDRHHNVRPTARWLADQFGKDKLHPKIVQCLQPGKNPHQKWNCRRIVLPAEHYDDLSNGRKLPWVSIYLDLDNQCIIDQRPQRTPIYLIPRWQTVSGSQYAYSPAVIAGLPDARLIQAMTLTLLEAGEMSVRPPMIQVSEVIQGGTQLYAGGVTTVDANYDERMGAPLRPVMEGKGNVPWGLDMLTQKEAMLAQAFYLNKLRALPQKDDMTAYEASVWTKEYIREVLPLFEPMESQYNGQLCDQTFTDLMAVNAFGPYQDIPRSVRGSEVRFTFESPVTEAIEREKAQRFIEAKSLIAEAQALDPASSSMVDAKIALRESLTAIRVPAKWMRSEKEVEQHAEMISQQRAEAAQAAQLQQGADTAAAAGKAAESFSKAQVA